MWVLRLATHEKGEKQTDLDVSVMGKWAVMSLNNDQDQEKKIKDYTVFKIHQKKSHLNIHSFCIVFETRRKNWQRLDVESRLFSMIFFTE